MAGNVILLSAEKYTPVQYPRENISPLDVYLEDKANGGYINIGPLNDLTEGSAKMPDVVRDSNAPNIIDNRNKGIDTKAGLSFLDGILARFNLGSFSLNSTYKKTRKFDMSFEKVLTDFVSKSKIFNYLNSSQPSAAYTGLIGGQNAYLITDTFKSSKIRVIGYDENNASVDAKAVVKSVVDLGWKGEVSTIAGSGVLYDGKANLVFGVWFVPIWIYKEGNKYRFKMGLIAKESTAATSAIGLLAWQGSDSFNNERNFNLLFDTGKYLIPQNILPGTIVDLKEKA
jgi:hypothetical protein